MKERKITEQEFNKAVEQVMQNMVNDPKLDVGAKLMVPLTGMAFVSEMKKILFKKEETETNE